jgi:hypothetical protein
MKNIRLPITQDDQIELYVAKYAQEKERADRLEAMIDRMSETIVNKGAEIDYLKRRNYHLDHDMGLLVARIANLEKIMMRK